jgi:carboxyl-terminal processing protease
MKIGGMQPIHRQSWLLLAWLIVALVSKISAAGAADVVAEADRAYAEKDYEKALQLYGQALQASPDDIQAWMGKGNAHQKKDEYDDAIAAYSEVLRRDSKNKNALKERGDVYFYQKRFDEALRDVDALKALDPKNPENAIDEAWNWYGKKEYAKAFDSLERALALKGSRLKCMELQARILAATGSYLEAVELFSQLHRAKPDDAEYLRAQGSAKWKVGRFEDAARDYEQSYSCAKEDAEIVNDYAWFLATCPQAALADGAKAIPLATKACELTRWRRYSYIDTLAAAYARAGNFEKAAEYQQKAIELIPEQKKKDDFIARRDLYRKGEFYTVGVMDQEKISWSLQRSECFDVVWRTVNDQYYDTTFGGVDWVDIRNRYRLRLWAAGDNRALRQLLQSMLDELHRTHFCIVPRDMSVLSPEERGRIGYTGAEVSYVQDAVTVVRVKAGSVADKAGLKCGDIVKAVGGHSLAEIEKTMAENVASERKRRQYLWGLVQWWLSAPVGKEVVLTLEAPDGSRKEAKMTTTDFKGTWSEAMGFSPSEPMEFETVRSENGVVYLRFNLFALPALEEFKRCVKTLSASNGLIIDLRRNLGGVTVMAPGMMGRLTDKETSLGTMRRRDGVETFVAYPQERAFLGPVAILVDAASASTSEILAAGMQESRRGRVFGEATAGAALPSLFRKLPTGDMLQYAVADIKTPKGILIEGNGVEPDETVVMTRADCIAGTDPVRAAAEKWIAAQLASPRKEAVR